MEDIKTEQQYSVLIICLKRKSQNTDKNEIAGIHPKNIEIESAKQINIPNNKFWSLAPASGLGLGYLIL